MCLVTQRNGTFSFDSMMLHHKPFHHKHQSPWDHSPLSQFWHAGFSTLSFFATETNLPPQSFATEYFSPLRMFRHWDQFATQNFRHAPNKHHRNFWISFSECIHWMHSTDNITNIYLYIFGFISLPWFITSLPPVNFAMILFLHLWTSFMRTLIGLVSCKHCSLYFEDVLRKCGTRL